MRSESLRYRYIAVIGIAVIISGSLALAGWQFDIAQLRSVFPGTTPMNPVSAATFLLCGAWLILFAQKRLKSLLPVLGIIVAIVGSIHFVLYFYPLPVRMDFLLHGDKLKNGRVLNLIAPNTAFLFLLSGISMLCVSSRRQWMQVVRQVLLVISLFLVYVSVLGYIFDIQPAYRLGGFTPMAVFTALVFLLLIAGLFYANVQYGLTKFFFSSLKGSRLLRRGFVFLLIVPPVIGYLRLVGEQQGLYPAEFGVELSTIVFALAVLALVILYALAENKRQLLNRRSEAQLAANEMKFRTVFNALKEGVACIDFSGRVLYCNPSYCRILGYSEQELVGNVVIEMIVPKAALPEFYGRLKNRGDGKEEDYQSEVIRKDGEKIWIDIKSRNITDAAGNASGYLVSVNDITNERHKIEDLQAFSGSAAHDLNSPLGRIISLTEFFGDGMSSDEEKEMYISMISETAYSMKQLLHDLLSFSKLGAVHFEKEEVSMHALVREICTDLTPKNFKGHIVIKDLPPVMGSEGAIKQLLTNLISNAIKYSSKKENSQVEIGAYKKEAQVVYYVKDNGVGLTKEQMSTLFTPFKRYHSDFEGNGLGLAIVKRVVEKHSGTIWAESEPGNGLTFHFILASDI